MTDRPVRHYTRRDALRLTTQATGLAFLARTAAFGASEKSDGELGSVVGQPVAAKIGLQVLKEGGNAIDAAITAAFAACICSPHNCGIGGYGGHAMIGLAGGKKITAIDFNSTAPAAAKAEMFPLNEKGLVRNSINTTGWLAAGVPGTIAGLELTLQRYGTRSLRDVLAPAIQLGEEGTYVTLVKGIDDVAPNDSGLDEPNNQKLPREKQRHLRLIALLKTLAAQNSTEAFYRGDIATIIAAAFQRQGGLVTKADLAAYRAREVTPLSITWNGATIYTPPVTATGLLLLQACSILKALDWQRLSVLQQHHAKLEALRMAWADRLWNFGDPEQVRVPVAQLISNDHAQACAAKIKIALRDEKPVQLDVEPSLAGGTVNLSATDRAENMIAITLTHGGSYGARVAVPELGLILGHGMSRFDPRPGRPNSPGPGKRPVNNMCPTIVTRNGAPVLALGAAGGTRIPNSVYEVLVNHVGLGADLAHAMAAPRLDCTGTLQLGLDKYHAPETEAFFKKVGYTVSRSPSAYVSAVAFDPAMRKCQGIASGGA